MKASEQVKLLLDLGDGTRESTQALVKAIESGDTDLVFTVILKIRDRMPLADFKVCFRTHFVLQFIGTAHSFTFRFKNMLIRYCS